MADDALTRKDAEMERLTRLVNVHRGWCNYCRGNVEWCDRCPEGGCALRDYLRSLESVREEARHAALEEAANTKPRRSAGNPPEGNWGGGVCCQNFPTCRRPCPPRGL